MLARNAKIWRPKLYRRRRWALAALALTLAIGFALGTALIQGPTTANHSLVERGTITVVRPGGAPTTQKVSLSRLTIFSKCTRAGADNCGVDGDTFRYGGEIIRIADIDAPETREAKCANEAQLGARATMRLTALLNKGEFSLDRYESRDRDRYGRLLRVVMRDGQSIGAALVSEGLARRWEGRRRPWC